VIYRKPLRRSEVGAELGKLAVRVNAAWSKPFSIDICLGHGTVRHDIGFLLIGRHLSRSSGHKLHVKG